MSNYLLSNSNIDIISDEIGAFLDKCKVDRKDAMRIKFAAEEILLNYQERFGEEQEIAKLTREFMAKLQGLIEVQIEFVDERFSSSIAEDMLTAKYPISVPTTSTAPVPIAIKNVFLRLIPAAIIGAIITIPSGIF